MMKTGNKGINLLKEFEGCRLAAYLCPAGVWTIGYGHTAGVFPGMSITKQQAEDLLKDDLHKYEQPVRDYVKVPLTQEQFDALVSFTYNCGIAALKGSSLLKRLNAGDYSAAADQLLNWNKAGGKVLAGLARRREAERRLFLSEAADLNASLPAADKDPIQAYSKALDGKRKLSDHFKIQEFACKDGSDLILIDQRLVLSLQAIRSHFGRPVLIQSAYRTADYNARVGGAKASMHLFGQAADIRIQGTAPAEIARYAEDLNIPGIGLYGTFVHIDTRDKRYWWDAGTNKALPTFK